MGWKQFKMIKDWIGDTTNWARQVHDIVEGMFPIGLSWIVSDVNIQQIFKNQQ